MSNVCCSGSFYHYRTEVGAYAQERVLGCGWRQPPDALSQGILEGGKTLNILSGKLSSLATWPCAQYESSEVFTLQCAPQVGFSTPLRPMCLPLRFRFPFGTNFLKMYALQCLTLGAQALYGIQPAA